MPSARLDGRGDRVALFAADLVERVERIVPAAVRFAGQLPASRHDEHIPGRDRIYLGLANHIVAHVEIFLRRASGAALAPDGVDEKVLRGLERRIDPPADLGPRARRATGSLRDWLQSASAGEVAAGLPDSRIKRFTHQGSTATIIDNVSLGE